MTGAIARQLANIEREQASVTRDWGVEIHRGVRFGNAVDAMLFGACPLGTGAGVLRTEPQASQAKPLITLRGDTL